MRRTAHVAAMLLALHCLALVRLGAQVDPAARWRTIATPHFRVHYTTGMEPLARRTAASAERAWGRLAGELAAPRGPVDVVLADNVDYSNGFATTFPSNRIVLYATPPVDAGALRNYADWMDLVVTHELTHVFHLDRSRGAWRLAQRVLGRNPALFPNTYAPSWLTEGLAVYYESRLTGSGRLAGTPHRVQALAAAMGGGSPRLDQLSAATPAFPGGNAAYVWGSLAVERLAAVGGADGVRRFVDHSAAELIPFRLDHVARAAFGESFSAAWRTWRDSLARAAAATTSDSGWMALARDAWDARGPRFAADGALAWPASFAREVPALWMADSAGRLRRVARRNSLDANAPVAGGVVFAQLEFTDAFTVRSDLWVERGGRRRRLTRGARLVQPDARDDGAIVAVQIIGGTTRLVRLTEAAPRPVPITAAHPDTQWSEPRWGHGALASSIVAVRRVRGGRSEVVRLDADGRATVLLASNLVEGSPVLAGACTLWSVSDRRGRPEALAVARACGDAPAFALGASGAPAGTAGVTALDASPDEGRAIAALGIGARGYQLLLRRAAVPGTDTVVALADTVSRARALLADTAGQGASAARTTAYRPWRSLRPTWWLPLTGQNALGTTMLGGYTSGSDVVGRHAWSLQALVPVRRADEFAGSAAWRWRGLGQPAIDVAGEQSWDYIPYYDRTTGAYRGSVAQRNRIVTLGATVVRPRFYTGASASAGLEYEWNTPVRTLPAAFRDAFRTFDGVGRPGAYVALGWSALQRAPLATSPEDGLSLAMTARERWQGDLGLGTSRTAVGIARAYRSIPFPGYAKHVLALRLSGGAANDQATSDFGVGGTSGASVEVLPGLVVGDVARTFGVRGFAPSTLTGSRAVGGVVEYRAPLLLANRGLGAWPLYLSRTGVTFFGDAGSAWCPVSSPSGACARAATARRTIASVGGELWLDASASYDVPYRIRLGVAVPVRDESAARAATTSVYGSFGVSF